MVSTGSYVLSAVLLAVLTLSLGYSAVGLRRWLLPAWDGAPARLVEAVVGVALLIWLSELLGVVGLLYGGALVASAVLLAAAVAVGPRVLSRGAGAGASLGFSPDSPPVVRDRDWGEKEDAAVPRHPPPSPPAGGVRAGNGVGAWLPQVVAVGVMALVVAHWGLTTRDALGRGVFNFDSLWYHLPFAVDMAQSHSVTGLHYTETVFTNWFYPQNSELLHSVGILLTGRDTLSLFLNLGWLGIAFLAAWCIGRPYGRAPLTTVAAAVILECHTLVVREPGAAKNDLMAAALLLAAIAILINAWVGNRRGALGPRVLSGGSGNAAQRRPPPPTGGTLLPVGWPLAVAGLAVGLAVGTKVTALAMTAALSLAVFVLVPRGRRLAAAGWWFAPALLGGGYWYLRNLVTAGNPIPQVESLGPISLPHPETLQSGRPDFSVAHYATDTAVWSDYFWPGLHSAFGPIWPLVIAGALVAGLLALIRGDRLLRWLGASVLFGLLAYLFTPLSAAGADGAPEAFKINLRFAIPPLLAGLTLLPVALVARRSSSATASPAGGGGEGGVRPGEAANTPLPPDRTRGRKPWSRPARTRGRQPWAWPDWALLGALLLLLVATNRADAVLRDPDRLFAWSIALLFVLIPAALLYARSRGLPRNVLLAGFAALALLVAALGYPVQRDYLRDRFANADPGASIPGMHLDSAYRWARGVRDTRIGLVGTTAGFLEYGFYGTDLSNHVRYVGAEGLHGAYNAIPTCAGFRAAVNAAELDYLVTAPFLNFIEPGKPIVSPEARWLRGEPAVDRVLRSGPVTVWKLRGRLDPSGCGAANAPRREIPN